jgi:GPH family glycoside/pentoside/hexuronide:cation symporter
LSKPTGAAPSLSLAGMLVFSTTRLPIGALGVALAIYVQPYFAQDLGVSLIVIAAALGIVRLLDVAVDPLLALAMDRTRTPLGRYRPWLILGAPIQMLATYALFMAHRGIGLSFLIVWLLILALGISITGLAHAAWSANLVTRYDQRARFYGLLAFASVAGNLIILLTPVFSGMLGPHRPNDVQLMGWIVLGLTPLGAALAAALTREPVTQDASSTARFGLKDYWAMVTKPSLLRLFLSSFATTLGPGWMSNLYLFFMIAARGFTVQQGSILLVVYLFAGALGAPLIGLIAARFSKHRTLMAATVCYSVGLCAVLLPDKGDVLMSLPVMAWCGFMGSGFDLMTSAMMADVGDEVRLEQGKERMALLFALITLAQKLANAGAVMIAYPLLAVIGYVPAEAAHNSPGAIRGLEIAFLSGPVFFVILGGLCFVGWRLDATRHAEIRDELEARDAALAQSALTEAGLS